MGRVNRIGNVSPDFRHQGITFFSLFMIAVIIYPIKTVCSSKCPTIVIKELTGTTLSPTSAPSTSTSTCNLTEEEKTQLNEGKCFVFSFWNVVSLTDIIETFLSITCFYLYYNNLCKNSFFSLNADISLTFCRYSLETKQ